MADAEAKQPFQIETGVAAEEDLELLRAQVVHLRQRGHVMAQLIKNKDGEIAIKDAALDKLASQLAELKAMRPTPPAAGNESAKTVN